MMTSDAFVATFIRACIFCQLLCVTTLIFGLLRSQILLLYEGLTKGIQNDVQADNINYRLSRGQNFMLSIFITIPPISLAIWYPYVGTLGALVASFSTMFIIYILPMATYTKAVYLE